MLMMPKDDPASVMPFLITLYDDQGRRVDFNYDTHGALYSVQTNQTYTTGSNPSLVSYQETDYLYDQSSSTGGTHFWLNELKNTFHNLSACMTTTLVQNDYTYDLTGQRLTNTISATGLASRTETYGYDVYNHLSSVNYGDGETQGYTFDAMGNRLTKTDNVTGNEGYGYNNANMLTSRTVGGTTNTYANDADGNTLTGGGRACTWDSQNRMVSCSYNGNTSSYVYGYDGIRRQATVNGVTTNFVTDNSMFVREMRGGVNYATYLMGARGPEYRRDDVAGTVRWYLYDGLGSVQGEVDPNGNVTASRKLDVYGLVRSSTGMSTSKHKFVGKLGHASDDESGLTYMQARYMDPILGRFVSEDPCRSGDNWFAYCRNNPVNSVDSTGRAAEDIYWLITLASLYYVQGYNLMYSKPVLLSLFRHLLSLIDDIANWYETDATENEIKAFRDARSGAVLGPEGADLAERLSDIRSSYAAGELGVGAAAKLAAEEIRTYLMLLEVGID